MSSSNTSPTRSIRHLDEGSWLEGISFLLSMGLQDLQIRCPKCDRIGTPTSKWVKGPKVKPLYVFHKNGHNEVDTCLLDKNEAQQAREQVALEEEDIKALLRSADAYVLFSGGVDSLCALDYLARIGSDIGREMTAIHVDTTVGFPEVTTYVTTVCKKLEITLKIVRPETDYFTLAKEWGIPGINCRWCCRELKIRPIMDFLAKMDNPKMVFDGIRAAESPIRAKYLPVWFHPSFDCLSVSPIFYWSDEDVHSYIKKRKLPPSPFLELGTSGECWCGAYKSRADFMELYRLHPEIYRKLMEVEESNKHGFTYVYEKGKRISLKDLAREIRQKQSSSSSM